MSQSIKVNYIDNSKIQEAVVLDDIEIIQNKYVMCLRKVLGKGSYAFVYQGYMKENENEQIAIKIIQKLGTEQKRKSFDVLSNFIKREKLNHGKLQSENIVKMIDFVEDEGSIYFILEFCEEKSLSDKLISGPLKENEALWIFKQVLNGYRELIESNIIHRDLKPENILFSKGIAKIGDFGFSIYLDDLNTTSDHTKLGTPLYTAPEISTGKYSSKADIWSLGVILYQMLYGYVPFDISVPKDLEKSKKLPIKYPNTISVDVIALLQKMLVVDQNQRISWQDLFAENLVGLIKAQQSQIQDQVTQSKVIKIDQKLDKEMKVQNIYNYFIYVSDILTFIRSLICEISKLQTAVKFSKEQIKHYNIITTKYLLNEIKFYLRVLNGEMLMQLLILPNDFQLFKKSDQYYQVLNNFKCNSETLEQFYQKIKEAYDKYFQQIQVQNTNKEIIKQFEFYSEGLKQNENNSKFYEAFNTIYLNLVDHIIEKVNHQKVLIEEKDHLFRTLIKLLHCFQPLQFSHHKLEAFKVEQKLRTSSSLEKEFNELYYQLLSKS